MLISLLGVGLLLMGVGYNPTPIASGVKYTQNNITKNEKIEIQRNNENSSTNYEGKQPFSIQATVLDQNQESINYQSSTSQYNHVGIIQKKKSHYQSNVGRITTITYNQRYLYQNGSYDQTGTFKYEYGQFKYSRKDQYTVTDTFNIATIQLDPYSNLFDTNAKIKLNIYLNDFLMWNTANSDYTWYDVYTNITIFLTTSDDFDTYLDLANWFNNQTIYQEMWTALNQTTQVVNWYYSNGAVRYNENGTAQTTGEARNNRDEEIPISIIPNSTNRIFVFAKPFIIAPVQTSNTNGETLSTNTDNYYTQFMQLINPTIEGYYIAGAINYEVVDIPGMMWEILTMPFSFISVAFNLTLFPGTPYQINISNLFLTIFGIMVVIWLLGRVKRFL